MTKSDEVPPAPALTVLSDAIAAVQALNLTALSDADRVELSVGLRVTSWRLEALSVRLNEELAARHLSP